jgi:hypothetical protein
VSVNRILRQLTGTGTPWGALKLLSWSTCNSISNNCAILNLLVLSFDRSLFAFSRQHFLSSSPCLLIRLNRPRFEP